MHRAFTAKPVQATTGRRAQAPGAPVPSVARGATASCVQRPAPARRAGKAAARHARTAVVSAAATLEAGATAPGAAVRSDIRNIAIIAHVDHGKTTLVDSMLAQSNIFRDNQKVDERIMDSNDLERERGITILAKNTAIRYKDTKLNIIDTPGHADFGGEVERVLNMCDGVLLLVDSVEGPMPQTRFVLRKALDLNKKVVVVVNKIDRPAARPDWVIDQVFDLFVDLGASDEQCDFPIVYASGFQGVAGLEPDALKDNLEDLFETVVNEVSGPVVAKDAPLQMLVTQLDFDEHKGTIAIGRLSAGTLKKQQQVAVCTPETDVRRGKVSEMFVYDNFGKAPATEVEAGDIVALAGLEGIQIGETITCTDEPCPLPSIEVEEPTVRMTFMINNSEFAGQEGKYVTSRNIRDRLMKELERNLALRVEDGDTADQFIVSGRGALHLGILIENMRREGYEFQIGAPTVIVKEDENGKKVEPYEEAFVEVPEDYVGGVTTLMGSRKAEMVDMSPGVSGSTLIKYIIPTRGLLGLKNSMLTATKGTAILNTNFKEYGPFVGDINTRDNGSLIAYETGQVTAYALQSAQDRGVMFVEPGQEVYMGQVVGIHQRAGDLKVNVCKKKALTNMRAAGKDNTLVLNAPKQMSLDECLEYIVPDELVEVTPKSVRIRKMPKKK
ncbi:unnamed protein product [Pedinophyceae sp. YPF-701]|nr:unnamed protein product [Pedinophyceae sp. YPF-701]